MPWILIGGAGGLAALELSPVAILAAFVLLALALTSKAWLEPMVSGLMARRGGSIARVLDIPGRAIRHAAASILSRVENSISSAATHRMHPLARWLYGLGSLAIGASWTITHYASDTAYAVERLSTVVIPREVHEVTNPLRHRATRALAGAIAAGLAIRNLRRYVARLWAHQIRPALHRLEHAIDVTIPRELGRIGVRVRDTERTLRHPSTKWLRRTAAALWGAALAGLFIRTLARRFPWLFCRQVKKVGGRICGLDPTLLDLLLLDVLVISGPISVRAFAEELQTLEHDALEIMAAGIRELPAP